MLLTLTNTGISNITDALANGTEYQITKMALGDYATAYTPSASLTALRGTEVYKSDIDSHRVLSNSRIEFIEVLGPSLGNFSFREVALLDSDDNLVAIGVDQNDNQYPKNATTNTVAGNSYTIVAVLEFSNVANAVDLTIVPQAAIPSATTTVQGIIELATQLEVNTGTDNERAVVPSTLENRINKMGSSRTYFVSAGTFVGASHSGEHPYEPVSFSSALTKATAHSSPEYDLSLVGIGREEVSLGNSQVTIPNGLNVHVPHWSITIGNNLVLQSPSHATSQRVGRFHVDRLSVSSGSLKIQPNYNVQIDSAVATDISIESGVHKNTSIKINDVAGNLSISSGASGTVHVDIAEYTGSAISVPTNMTLIGKINETWYGLPAYPEATDVQKGIIERADQDEADAGTDNERAMTPALVNRLTNPLDDRLTDLETFPSGVFEYNRIATDSDDFQAKLVDSIADGIFMFSDDGVTGVTDWSEVIAATRLDVSRFSRRGQGTVARFGSAKVGDTVMMSLLDGRFLLSRITSILTTEPYSAQDIQSYSIEPVNTRASSVLVGGVGHIDMGFSYATLTSVDNIVKLNIYQRAGRPEMYAMLDSISEVIRNMLDTINNANSLARVALNLGLSNRTRITALETSTPPAPTPRNKLYGSNGSEIYIIDPSDGATTTLGPTQLGPRGGGGLSYISGILYYVRKNSPAALYKISLDTGAATLVGSLSRSFDGSFHVGTTLYGVTKHVSDASKIEIHSINKTSGASALVSTFTVLGNAAGGGMARRSDSLIYYAIGGSSSIRDRHLYKIVPGTWSVTSVGTLDSKITTVSAISFVGSSLYSVSSNEHGVPSLFSVNTTDASATQLATNLPGLSSLETILR